MPISIFRLSYFAILALSSILFVWQLETPVKVNYDEAHYVPAARALLEGRMQNREHPPLAKYFFALSIKTFGDNPIGWRMASVVFGVVTLAAIMELAWLLFASEFWTLFCGILTLLNFVLFVQSRIAMLDTIMTAFLMWAFVFLVKTDAKNSSRTCVWTGVFFGLAIAAKWAALPTALLCLPWMLWRFHKTKRPMKPLWLAAEAAVLVYFATFLPLFFLKQDPLSLRGLFALQKEMLDLHMSLKAPHSYSSQWWQWPLLIRPMWYAFDQELEITRGVLLIGNPVLFFAGFFSIVLLSLRAWKHPERDTLLVLLFYYATFLPWLLFPRPTSFFYYYYPSALLLGPALIAAFRIFERRYPSLRQWALVFLVVCFSLFVDFYPILAGIPLPNGTFMRWVWFKNWL